MAPPTAPRPEAGCWPRAGRLGPPPPGGGAIAASRVVTLLFTDLVGSTEIASRLDPLLGDDLRDRHFSVLREAITEHGGTEVKNLGDGLMVVFGAASGALACAVAMQQATARFEAPITGPLAIRVGLAHGEVTEADGDYFGDVVVEAARLCAVAAGGQILASELVRQAAGRRAMQEFVPVGSLALKGLGEVPAVEVSWDPPDPGSGNLALPRRCTVSPVAGFVGRAAERARLDAARKAAFADGSPRLVLVGGEPGIGKTSLAIDFARAAHDDGAIVLYGRAEEDLTIPYGPWVEAASHLIDEAPRRLVDELAHLAPSLARLSPAIGARLGDVGGASSSDAETARYLLFGAVVDVLAAAAAEAPVVLLLDDLHWADPPSLQLLRHVVSAARPMRLVILGTFRESDIVAGSPLGDLLGALHREPNIDRITLRGLDDLELLALMESAAGQQMDADGIALRDALAAETDGNPFFAGELLRHLAETGAIYQGDDGRWVAAADRLADQGLPVSVVEVIGRRVARLGAEVSRVLGMASVIGRDFDLEVLATAAEVDAAELLDALQRAIDATLVDNVDGDRYTFVHALIERTLYESIPPARRSRMHRRVAEAIEAVSADHPQRSAAALAHHWTAATTPLDLDKAVHYARAAGDDALARLAPDEALRWYRQALGLVPQLGAEGDGLRCALLVGIGDAQRQVGDPGFRETLLEAAGIAQAIGDTDLLVTAALTNTRDFVSSAGVIDEERVAVLEAAREAAAGTAAEPMVLALLANELTYHPLYTRRAELADQALALARELGDNATTVAVIIQVMQAIHVPETLDRRLELSAEAIELAQHLDDPIPRFWSATFRAVFLVQARAFSEADEHHAAAQAIAEQLGQPRFLWVATFNACCRAMLAADLAEAERLCFEAAELASRSGQPDSAMFFGAQLTTIRIMQGRAAEIVDLVREVVADNPGVPVFASSLAQALSDLDRPDEAREALRAHVAEEFRTFPQDLGWLGGMCQSAAAVADTRWVEAAQILYDGLAPYGDQIFTTGLTSGVDTSYWLGRLATVLGRYDAADAHFAHAAATHEHLGAWARAMTRIGWAQCLLERGKPEDRDRAVGMLQAAQAEAITRGFAVVERRAREALAAAG